MIKAVMNNLHEMIDVEVLLTRDDRLDAINGFSQARVIKNNDDPFSVWKDYFLRADATIIIAPETDNTLLNLTELAEQCECTVMGCAKQAIELTSSKLRTQHVLETCKILLPKTYASILELPFEKPDGWIVKPDDGVGAESCQIISRQSELQQWLDQNSEIKSWLVQEFIVGTHASFIMLCLHSDMRLLSINEQVIEIESSEIKLKQIHVNGLHDLYEKIHPIALNIAKNIPGLWGLIGVDFIQTKVGTVILEINPRFTTAFCGLSQSINYNPVKYLLSMLKTNELPEMKHIQNTRVTVDL